VPENFDVGPLTWVKDEINQALDAVLENIDSAKQNPHDTSVFRFSKTHLYQASGALDMVGLEGCKRFSDELEKLAGKLEQKAIALTPELADDYATAVRSLKAYIQDLLNGAMDVPLRLYPALKPLVEAQGGTLEESELFFPDTTSTAPKDIPSKELEGSAYAQYLVEQRLSFQKSLLDWLQNKQNDAVRRMTDAMANVSQVQKKSSDKTLWWAASAFTESLEEQSMAQNAGAKRLCRRLDQELRSLSEGVQKPHSSLLRDVLYYVAVSSLNKPIVNRVKQVFALDSLTGRVSAGTQFKPIQMGETELANVSQLMSVIDALHEIWDEVSNAIDFTKMTEGVASHVKVDDVLLTRFTDLAQQHVTEAEALSHEVIKALYHATRSAVSALQGNTAKATQAALIEIAAGLHLLKDALMNYQAFDAERAQGVQEQTFRLENVIAGNFEENVAPERLEALDISIVKAVVSQIKESLQEVEQALDAFFRNPTEKSTLLSTPKHTRQVVSIFDMLNQAIPTGILQACEKFIHHFQQEGYQPQTSHFELVAESISMLGFFADELPKPRQESAAALGDALVRLNTALEALSVAGTTEEKLESGNIAQTSESDREDKVVDQAYDDELLDIYLAESEEVLAHIAQNLQALRVNPTEPDALVEVRRSYHTLKGSGRTVGLAALGELAGKVEFFLNALLDKKSNLNSAQISGIEQITAAFADLVSALRTEHRVEVPQAYWLARIAGLPNLSDQQPPVSEAMIADTSVVKPKKAKAGKSGQKEDAYVLVGGTRKLARGLYEIFINESMQNVTKLEQDLAKLKQADAEMPSAQAKRAVHTLASNALATGFTPLGELGRALEGWLDEAKTWTPKQTELYDSAVHAISGMWQKVSELKNPRAARALIKVLNEAAEVAKASQVGDVENLQVEELDMEAFDRTFAQAVKSSAEESGTSITVISNEPNSTQEENDVSAIEVKLATGAKSLALDRTDVDNEVLTMFVEEAQELVPEIGVELRAWRSNPRENKYPEALQRSLHTLKGSARMANQKALGDMIHELEDKVVRAQKRQPVPEDFLVMFEEFDQISGVFEESKGQAAEDVVKKAESADTVPTARAVDRKAQFLRMRADALDRMINEAGEISIIRSRMDREVLGFKQSSSDLTESLTRLRGYLRELEIEAETQMQSRMSTLQEAHQEFDPLEFDRFTRLQELTRMIAESVNDVSTIQQNILQSVGQTEAALQQQNRMNRDLQQGLLGVRMLPFKQISERLQRIVRQTARELKKSADLEIIGDATEIDRSMLDKLSAPLEHLLRNAVAHGIESPSERRKRNKPEMGTIKLRVQQQNDEISISVADDGAGVNLEKVKEKAIKNNLIDKDAHPTEQALLSVIFEPGFSTAERASQIAGRGVGLDVVRNEISGLGGRVDLTSEPGNGATFDIHLPVTLSVAQVLMVRSGNNHFAVPVAMIEHAQKIKRADLIEAYKQGQIRWADKQYPLHYLSKLLDHQEHQPEDHPYVSVLLLRSGTYHLALHVDEVIGNQEVVMKPIGPQLARVPGITGATVAGDGQIVLIINPVQIANREILSAGNVMVKAKVAETPMELVKLRALVVDDSLTMRKVLGRLLERAGFEVMTAKDGMDAMQLLQDSVPDVILTDIEMPRMDGFGLSRNIRDDVRTAKTPLIMISSRTADKHQNAAREIGVDAFFGKPVQDEELINKINELIRSAPVSQ